MTWFFEEKTAWVVGLAMTVCFIHVSIRETFQTLSAHFSQINFPSGEMVRQRKRQDHSPDALTPSHRAASAIN